MTFLSSGRWKTVYHFLIFFLLLSVLSLIMLNLYYPADVYLSGSDGLFHYQRFLSVHDAVGEGSYPYFIDLNYLSGYGYAVSLFYPDWLLLPFALLIDCLGGVTAFKFMLLCAALSCGLVSYLMVHKLLKNNVCATLFALLYTFSWYRLLDMSTRSAIGELWSFTFIPLVVWGAYEIVRGDYARKWYILVIGMTGLLYCHLISALLTVVVLTVFLAILFKSFVNEPKRLKYLVVAGLTSLLLSAGFVFPLLEQLQSNTFYFETKPSINAGEWLSPVGRFFAGLVRRGIIGDSMTNVFVVSVFLLLALVISLFAYRAFIKKSGNPLVRLADKSVLAGLLVLAALSDIFPWSAFPFDRLLHVIQFTWRLLVFVSFFWAFAISVYLYLWILSVKYKYSYIHTMYVCMSIYTVLSLLIVLQMKSSASSFQQSVYKSAYVKMLHIEEHSAIEFTVAGGEYIPSALPDRYYPQERGDKISALHDDTEIRQFARHKDGVSFRLKTNQKDVLELPLLYYKGYHAELDGKTLEPSQNANGLVEIAVPQSGHVKVRYGGTIIQKLSVSISVTTLLGLLVWFCLRKKHKK